MTTRHPLGPASTGPSPTGPTSSGPAPGHHSDALSPIGLTVAITALLVGIAGPWITVGAFVPFTIPFLAIAAAVLFFSRALRIDRTILLPLGLVAVGSIVALTFNETPFRSPRFVAELALAAAIASLSYSCVIAARQMRINCWPAVLIIVFGFGWAVNASGTSLTEAATALVTKGSVRAYLNNVFLNGATELGDFFGSARLASNVRHVMTETLVLCIALIIWRGTRLQRQILIPICAVAIVFSLSRSTWLAIAIPLAILAVERVRHVSRTTVIHPVWLIVVISSPIWIPALVMVTAGRLSGAEDSSAQVRELALATALRLFGESPLIGAAVPRSDIVSPHNILVDCALSGGVVALVGAAVLVWRLAVRMWQGVRWAFSPLAKGITPATTALLFFCSLALTRCLTAGDPFRELPIWAAVGMSSAIFQMVRVDTGLTPARSRART